MRFIYTRAFAMFVGGLVIVAILVLLQVKGFMAPIRNVLLQAPRPVVYVVRGVSRPVKNFFSTLFSLRAISSENIRLSSRVLELEQNLVELDRLRIENEALRKELDFTKATTLHLRACTVLGQNPLDLTDAIVLGCGTEDGIQIGQAVVTQGFLVGKVVFAAKDTSTVLLITNPNFSVDAKLSSSGVEAIVKGSFGSGFTLDQVSQTAVLERGTLVVTAGISERIPKNILIGEVGEVLSSPNDLFKRATLISPINFRTLEFVFVVMQ